MMTNNGRNSACCVKCKISQGQHQVFSSTIVVPSLTVRMRPRSIQPIYVVSLFCICSIHNADDIILKHTCPPCWENDLNNVIGIDNIKD